MNENVPEKYQGLTREECRDACIEDLKAEGLLLEIEPLTHEVGHSERTGVMVEPMIKEQWFVKMEPLAKKVLEFQADKEKKIIKLNTSFKAGSITQPFVCLTETEISFLRKHHDNKLCNYLIYMKYYCGMCKNTGQNFTAEQFLTNCGYSTRANSNYDDLSRYNKLLEDAGIITIIRYRDDDKKKRNTYKYNQSYLYLSQDR
jgi:hypothetical protein